jgi:drug/metabolite transporter (DMT)-like permease
VILGVVLALVTTLAYNSSFVLEKRALAALPALELRVPVRLVRCLMSSPAWMFGFGLMLAGLACQLVALSKVPLTVAQPVFSSGIAFLLVLTTTVLGERLTRDELFGVAGIAAGVVCVVLSLNTRSDAAGTGGHLSRVIVVAVPSMAVGVLAFAAAHLDGKGVHRRPAGDLPYGVAAGVVYGVVGLVTKGLSASIDYRSVPAMAWSALTSPYLYLVAGLTGVGMLLFQTGLQRCRASIFVPVSSVVSTLYTITVGTILFGERLPGDGPHFLLRGVGLVVIIAALVWLPRGRRSE